MQNNLKITNDWLYSRTNCPRARQALEVQRSGLGFESSQLRLQKTAGPVDNFQI